MLPIIGLIVILAVIAAILQLIKHKIDGRLYTVLLVIIVLSVFFLILSASGLLGGLHLNSR